MRIAVVGYKTRSLHLGQDRAVPTEAHEKERREDWGWVGRGEEEEMKKQINVAHFPQRENLEITNKAEISVILSPFLWV
jgi:hypothetical protein